MLIFYLNWFRVLIYKPNFKYENTELRVFKNIKFSCEISSN